MNTKPLSPVTLFLFSKTNQPDDGKWKESWKWKQLEPRSPFSHDIPSYICRDVGFGSFPLTIVSNILIAPVYYFKKWDKMDSRLLYFYIFDIFIFWQSLLDNLQPRSKKCEFYFPACLGFRKLEENYPLRRFPPYIKSKFLCRHDTHIWNHSLDSMTPSKIYLFHKRRKLSQHSKDNLFPCHFFLLLFYIFNLQEVKGILSSLKCWKIYKK